ncbi:MAG: hypothetical protein LKJ17_04530 [Oscillospiraceae bacterium]|jgi:hypothetical protein|nr:hypothetical protein [Oscillospiraceae bacterium]
MTIREIRKILAAALLTDGKHQNVTIHSACGSDMMSDVLAFAKNQPVLLTGLINPQVVRTAEMMDIRCIVFVRGKKPEADLVRLAQACGIELLSTSFRMYTACGLLYSHGLLEGPVPNE